nr:unnamed protein product [Callosobruchus chinensis]
MALSNNCAKLKFTFEYQSVAQLRQDTLRSPTVLEMKAFLLMNSRHLRERITASYYRNSEVWEHTVLLIINNTVCIMYYDSDYSPKRITKVHETGAYV